nr:hypothetical protein [Veillonella denticariosi]
MNEQTSYWNRLVQPGGIVALVGAGGKTTVLSKLVEYGRLKGQPMVVTTTTRLYESQVLIMNRFIQRILMKPMNIVRNVFCAAIAVRGFRALREPRWTP